MAKKKTKKKRALSDEEKMEINEAAAISAVSVPLTGPGSLKYMRDRAVPKDIPEQITKVQQVREKNNLIQALINIKIAFGYAGFHNETDDPKAQDYYDKIASDHDFDSLVLNLWEHLETTDNMILHWKMNAEKNNQKNIAYITALDPGLTKVETAFDTAFVYVKPDQSLIDFVNQSSKTEEEKEAMKDIPDKWIAAVKRQGEGKHKQYVQLSKNDKEFVILKNTKGFPNRLISPSMNAILFDLDLMDKMIDGDAQVALYTKNMIMLVRGGENAPTAGNRAGSTHLYLQQPALDKMNSEIQSISKSLALVLQKHWDIDFVFPDQRYWNATKYDAVIKRILRWARIGQGLLIGEGGNYSLGYINMKGISADVLKKQRIISRAIEQFYMAIKPPQFKIEAVPNLAFNKQILKEPRQLREEIALLLKQGPLSVASALEATGHSPRIEKARKKEEMKEIDIHTPIFEPGQGGALASQKAMESNIKQSKKKGKEPDQPGNPDGDEPKAPKDTPREPRPSEADISEEIKLEADTAPFKGLPAEAFKIWEKVYKAERHEGTSKKSAAKQAWKAVKNGWKKVGDKWVKKGD